MPDEITVANSSCLIALEAVGRLDLLRDLYTSIDVPDAVSHECGANLPDWIRVHTIQNQQLAASLKLQLGDGEAEAITLACELSAARLILDDKKARRIARQLGAPVTGTLAILLAAKDRGLVPAVRDILDAVQATGFHVSSALRDEVLRRCGE
jgi:predicted nucleic acid-binding protein